MIFSWQNWSSHLENKHLSAATAFGVFEKMFPRVLKALSLVVRTKLWHLMKLFFFTHWCTKIWNTWTLIRSQLWAERRATNPHCWNHGRVVGHGAALAPCRLVRESAISRPISFPATAKWWHSALSWCHHSLLSRSPDKLTCHPQSLNLATVIDGSGEMSIEQHSSFTTFFFSLKNYEIPAVQQTSRRPCSLSTCSLLYSKIFAECMFLAQRIHIICFLRIL